jgi:uncharacterized protein YjbJ (UPF0337 family)
MMERSNVEGSWKQIKGQFESKWTKLTKDDIEGAHGKFDLLAVALEKRYGLTKAVAEKDLDAFITGMEQPKNAEAKNEMPAKTASNKTANGDIPRGVT